MRAWVLLLLPLSAWACDACKDADVAKQGMYDAVVSTPAQPVGQAEIAAPPGPIRERAGAEVSVGGSSEPVDAKRPRSFIRSFNELK